MKKIIKTSTLIILAALLSSCAILPNESSNSQNVDSEPNSHSSTSENITETETSNSSSETSENISTTLPTMPDNPDKGTGEGVLENGLAVNPQDGVILHAWSWSMNAIKEALPDIAKAGYSAVQTSPMQPQKDFYNGDSIRNWWKVYQPLGFQIATEKNALGTKNDLIQLCDEADKYGIKVIVDVVANHLAGGNSKTFHRDVQKFEPVIYDNDLKHDGNNMNSDLDGRLVVQGNIGGFPDLKTEDSRVQDAVLDLLKEYIDCGVDGFRFDAAKHIELPEDDPSYASDFWNVTLNGAKQYAKEKGLHQPYSYGEILNTCGQGRSFKNYTKRMSVTDSNASGDVINAVIKKDAFDINQKDIYNDGITSNKAVLWGESHDTFANNDGATKNVDPSLVNKAYAINASRNNATSLYFPRPSNDMKLGGMTNINDWKSHNITEVNKFHNHFIASKENIFSDDDQIFANYKQKDNEYGALLVNLSNTNKICIDTFANLAEGQYIDKISGREVIVSNGLIDATFDGSGIMVLYSNKVTKPANCNRPFIRISGDASNINISVINGYDCLYQINGGKFIPFEQNVKINPTLLDDEGEIKIDVSVMGFDGRVYSKSKVFSYANGDPLNPRIKNVDLTLIQDKKIAIWVWDDKNSNKTSRWVTPVLMDDKLSFNVNSKDSHFIVAIFDEKEKIDWKNCLKQTENIKLGQISYDFLKLPWKN